MQCRLRTDSARHPTSPFPPPDAVDRAAAGQPLILKISPRMVKRSLRPPDLGESTAPGDDFPHLFKVFDVVGLQKPFAGGFEKSMHGLAKIRGDQSIFMVAFFWPGVGKKQVNPRNCRLGQQMTHRVGAFDSENLHIARSHSRGQPRCLARPPEQSLDAKKIAIGMLCRERDEESAVPATEIDFKRAGGAGKNFLAPQPPKIIRRFVESGRSA